MSNTNPTQRQRVLDYMREHGCINPLESWQQIGVYRLAARINELHKSGVGIVREWVEVPNRYGETCRVRMYSIAKGQMEMGL